VTDVTHDPLPQALAEALGGSRREGRGWRCRCPAHDDHDPSLSIETRAGRTVFVCRAGCDQETVLAALRQRDLWPESGDRRDETSPRRRSGSKGRIVATYDYRDPEGELRYQVTRLEPKDFRQRRPDGKGGWIWKMAGVEPLPYRLPELLGDPVAMVFVAEGEKDCDNLYGLGIVATCNHGGAGKWRDEISAWLQGRQICILPDNDASGRDHAKDVARKLHGIAAEIRILELAGLGPKGDVSDWIAAGGTADELERLAAGAARDGGPEPRFRLVRFRDIRLGTSSYWLIKDIIPREGLVVVWGSPICGKTFFVYDLVMHVALGREYRGKRVEQGTVVYVAAEGELGIKARVEAFRKKRMNGEDPPFYLLTTRLDLVAEIDELIVDIRAQLLPADRCSAIVLDTLNRTIHGSESRDEDMGAYRAAADRLREEFHCAAIIIHHCGVNGDRPRGHTSLTGAADAQIATKRDAEKNILATVEYVKDGAEGLTIASRLEAVMVGTDDNGDEIWSCVIEPVDAPAAAPAPAKKLPAAAQLALDQLRNAIKKAGEELPHGNHVPAGARGVSIDLWRRYCYAAGIAEDDKSEDTKSKAFRRAFQTLVAIRQLVGCCNDMVWIVKEPAGSDSRT
jgi:hypothetical protein